MLGWSEKFIRVLHNKPNNLQAEEGKIERKKRGRRGGKERLRKGKEWQEKGSEKKENGAS
jgi:hypothetical protein